MSKAADGVSIVSSGADILGHLYVFELSSPRILLKTNSFISASLDTTNPHPQLNQTPHKLVNSSNSSLVKSAKTKAEQV